MKKVCIFSFSGTGMTNYVVDLIKAELEKRGFGVDVKKIEYTNVKDVDLEAYDSMGIAYPVHSFNAPKIVVDFARTLPMAFIQNSFVISTAGDYSVINASSSRHLIKTMNKKNHDVFYDKQFVMPSNFMMRNKFEVSKLLEMAQVEASKVADAIRFTSYHKSKDNVFTRIISVVGRIEWLGAKVMGKFFYSNEKCTGCKTCVKYCPNRNIKIEEKQLKFKWKCGLCMRCLYSCPEQAIEIRHPFKFIKLKEWYENPEFTLVKKKPEVLEQKAEIVSDNSADNTSDNSADITSDSTLGNSSDNTSDNSDEKLE